MHARTLEETTVQRLFSLSYDVLTINSGAIGFNMSFVLDVCRSLGSEVTRDRFVAEGQLLILRVERQ